jgi:hypothetical protein
MPASLTLYLPATQKPTRAFDWRFALVLAAPVLAMIVALAAGVDVSGLAPQM